MSVPTQPIDDFYYDELSKIRVLEPQVAVETVELKEECKEFVDSWFLNNANFYCRLSIYCPLFPSEISAFQELVGKFMGIVDELAVRVDDEKMKAIGIRNHLKSTTKEREAQKHQLQSLIAEKKMQLER